MYLSVFLGVLLLSSCKTARDMVSENDICGEWNVVEIQGEPVRAQSNPLYRIRYEERESIWI